MINAIGNIIGASRRAEPELPSIEFLTGFTQGSLRNDASVFVGFTFTVGAAPMLITHLGRWIVSGNNQSHELKIMDADSTDLVSAVLNTAGKPAEAFAYVKITPIVLAANTLYAMYSLEEAGLDQWYQSTNVTWVVGAGMVNVSVYRSGGVHNGVHGEAAFVPPNFKYVLL